MNLRRIFLQPRIQPPPAGRRRKSGWLNVMPALFEFSGSGQKKKPQKSKQKRHKSRRTLPALCFCAALAAVLPAAEPSAASDFQNHGGGWQAAERTDGQITEQITEKINGETGWRAGAPGSEGAGSRGANFEAFWKANVSAKAFTDQSAANAVLNSSIYGKINWILLDRLSIQAKALITGRSGFTQSIYDRSDRRSGFHFLEGFFHLKPYSYLSLKLGSVQQDFLQAPLLITDQTFPSLMEIFSFEPLNFAGDFAGNLKLSLAFQQAIPDNALESVKMSAQIVRGLTPLFLTASAFAEWDSVSQFDLLLKNRLSFFHYTKISPAVACESSLYGNTALSAGCSGRLKHGFMGLYNHFSLQAPFLSKWLAEIGLDILYNFKAPDTYNQGERLAGALYYDYKSFMEIQMAAEYFALQSDASLAYYSSPLYGRNNRTGALLRAQAHLYDSGLTFKAVYVYSRPINQRVSPFGASRAFALSLGTNYLPI